MLFDHIVYGPEAKLIQADGSLNPKTATCMSANGLDFF